MCREKMALAMGMRFPIARKSFLLVFLLVFVPSSALAQEFTLARAVEVALERHPALVASSFFTLLVVPVLYNLIFGGKARASTEGNSGDRPTSDT